MLHEGIFAAKARVEVCMLPASVWCIVSAISTQTEDTQLVHGWRPISEAEAKPGYINVRSVTTYRWLPYKPDGARQTKKAGRWQVCGEYGGWTNADLPEGAEFIPNIQTGEKP